MKPLDAISKILAGEKVPDFRMQLPPTVAITIGFEPKSIAKGEAVFVLDANMERHANPMGTLHGGILCDVADGAMGMACASLLEEGESFTTLELKINYLRPVRNAKLEARAKAVHAGKTQVYLECELVTVPDEKLVAKANSTCLILRGELAKGR
jgi:uncharacterized protein (TIGR00369 family)